MHTLTTETKNTFALSYKIAFFYVCRQNRHTTLVDQKASNRLKAFYNTIEHVSNEKKKTKTFLMRSEILPSIFHQKAENALK